MPGPSDSRPLPAASPEPVAALPLRARRLLVGGRVQGVGFRPYVYRLASGLGLSGWVQNELGQVSIVVQGSPKALARFERKLCRAAPPLARPVLHASRAVPADLPPGFAIRPSRDDSPAAVHVPPDQFACEDCLRELQDPTDRRYRYPFVNCTQCGPRYTLITRLPYDRSHTTMAGLALCPACRAEYEDPADRRFHAQPLACPACGPQLHYRQDGHRADGAQALVACVAALREGRIVAVKGIGGYHLMCDAANAAAVARLRAAKPRPHKPLAVLIPRRGPDGLAAVREATQADAAAAALLTDPMRPIVLLAKRPHSRLAANLAPGLAELGVMLPYSPLHQLLLAEFGGPLVATSANLSGEPVLTDGDAVEARLARVTQACLHHDRPIARPADDPLYRVIAGRARPLRLGRGNAPLEQPLPYRLRTPLLAVGAHMKNTVALAWDDRVVVSPHIGDLHAPRSLAVFEQVLTDLQQLYGVQAQQLVCDAHRGYASSRWARAAGLPCLTVFHHHAHAGAVAGEYPDAPGPWLVFTWDGVGYGPDGTLWGGEALLGGPGAWRRVARLRPFHLPGGERAGREPWRSALALCLETDTAWPAAPAGAAMLRHAWQRRLNTPRTTAVGRLFDAAAALTGLLQVASFEGQGPMLLEAVCAGGADPVILPLARTADGLLESDWAPLLPMLLDARASRAERAARFHASLAHVILAQARAVRAQQAVGTVGLAGGVFQNRRLTEHAFALLEADGFGVALPAALPCNDAGLSFGQVIEAAAQRDREASAHG